MSEEHLMGLSMYIRLLHFANSCTCGPIVETHLATRGSIFGQLGTSNSISARTTWGHSCCWTMSLGRISGRMASDLTKTWDSSSVAMTFLEDFFGMSLCSKEYLIPFFICYYIIAVVWLTLLLHIREVLGSNFGTQIGCTDWGFRGISYFLEANVGRYLNKARIIPPMYFQLVIHLL